MLINVIRVFSFIYTFSKMEVSCNAIACKLQNKTKRHTDIEIYNEARNVLVGIWVEVLDIQQNLRVMKIWWFP
jgi:hypothetical protein